MTLYELLRQISEILAPKRAGELYDYFLHTFDDNDGFVRTRHCRFDKNDKVLNDRKLRDDIRSVFFSVIEPFDFDKDELLGKSEGMGPRTLLKAQMFYFDAVSEDAEENAAHGFDYPILIDLVEKKFQMLDRITDIY